jgi:hypothetical protein
VICPRCDQPAEAGARFCVACGAPLADATTTQEPVVADTVAHEDVDATPEVDPSDRPGAGGGALTATARPATVPTEVAEGVRDCPVCGAPNSRARLLCARCGADLETGAVEAVDDEVVRPGPAVDVAGDVDVTDGDERSRTAAVVATIIVVGAVVGVAIGIWAVRAGAPEEAAAPVFDEAVYPGEPEDLVVGGVGASSIRPDAGETTYGPANMVDGDPTTAWSHDPASQAATEVDLAFALEDPAWVTAVVVANGAQADAGSFAADGRVEAMLLVVDGEPLVEMRLLDRLGYQRVDLPTPVLAQTLRFVISEEFAGDTFPEVSLSEVAFVGHPATGDDLDLVTG